MQTDAVPAGLIVEEQGEMNLQLGCFVIRNVKLGSHQTYSRSYVPFFFLNIFPLSVKSDLPSLAV